MAMINFLNQLAINKSVDQNAANLVNLYLQEDQDQGKYSQANGDPVPYVAYPTPGATLFSAGTSIIRASWSQHGVTYVVDGNTLYSLDNAGNRTSLGTLNTSTGWCKIRGIQQELFIADSSNGYYYLIASNTFGTIVNSGSSVTSVEITNPGSGYSPNVTVSFSGGGGSGAAGTVVVSGGQITAVDMTSAGAGYTSVPTVTFNDTTGTGATGLAQTQVNSFPTSIQDIECQDEMGLVQTANSQIWQSSSISDLTTWPALAFASTSGSENYNVAIISCHRELYLLGATTTEVWDNLGQANFTFGRNQSVFIQYGCAARGSVAQGANTIYFLGQSTGQPVVISMVGYNPTVISTRSINYLLSTYSTVSDAIGFIYTQEGHEFYVLTLPTAGVTFVYDISTGMWHQRQSSVSGTLTNWLASSYTFNYGLCLVGDLNSGNVYSLDMTNFTENGTDITRILQTHPFYQGGWVALSKLQIDFDNSPGSGLSNWTLYVSRNGGRTFGTGKTAVVQQDAYGLYRVYWNRLGLSHSWVFKLETTSPMQCIILGAWGNYENRAG